MTTNLETASPFTEEQVRIVPANEASWEDLVAIFGTSEGNLIGIGQPIH
jgi:hypothetical protein